MKTPKTATKVLIAALAAAMFAGSIARADCVKDYQAEIKELEPLTKVTAHTHESGVFALAMLTSVVPYGVTLGITSTHQVKINDRKKMISVIREAYAGDGLNLIAFYGAVRAVHGYNLDRSAITKAVIELDERRLLCLESPLAYSEATILVERAAYRIMWGDR